MSCRGISNHPMVDMIKDDKEKGSEEKEYDLTAGKGY
jgi:hypothetical protein